MSNRKLKLSLYAQNPRCYYCNRETVLTNEAFLKRDIINPRMATVEHLISRYHPKRWEKRKPGEIRKVLACFECNQARSKEETERVSKEELYKRGHGFSLNPRGKPNITRTFNSIDDVIKALEEKGVKLNVDTNKISDRIDVK